MSEVSIGDIVKLSSFGNKSGNVKEVRKNSLIVEIGGISVECKKEDVSLVKQKSKKIKVKKNVSTGHVKKRKKGSPIELDLHGMTQLAAIEAIDTFISNAVLHHRDEVHIVHGKGNGILKKCTETHLQSLTVVKRFCLSEVNHGVTIVYL